MKILGQWMKSIACTLAVAVLSNFIIVGAQAAPGQEGKAQKPKREVIVEQDGIVITGGLPGAPLPPPDVMPAGRPGGGDTFVFISSEMSFDGRVVKGAPYSAEAITETTQMLSDGNRIVRKTTATVYRDSEGRTRRDQTLGAIGPFSVANDPPQTFFINDPVAGVHYILDPRSRTARKLVLPRSFPRHEAPLGSPEARAAARARQRARVEAEVFTAPLPPPPGQGITVAVAPPPGVREYHFSGRAPAETKKESLGEQVIEGVRAVGTRNTTTIPAGEIGNELPILIVSERWYSDELQTVVMTKHSDPRFGETVYRLTNINRSEPARTVFEVPADYKIKEGPKPMIRSFQMKKPDNEQ